SASLVLVQGWLSAASVPSVQFRHSPARVRPRAGHDQRGAFALRLLLGPAAPRLAAGHADPAQLRRLDELCRTLYRLGANESAEALLRANPELHVTMARAPGNERLAGLLDEMERLFHLGLRLRDRNDEMFHEHYELIEALLTGDDERAEQVTIGLTLKPSLE